MKDQGNSDRNDKKPQAPKFMRPQRPVLDEPLIDEEPREKSDEGGSVPEEIDQSTNPAEATQELRPEPEIAGQAEHVEGELGYTQPTGQSPYFPRGIYEDAQSVEAYYGRGDAGSKEKQSQDQVATVEDDPQGRWTHWLILIFAILMILVLLFLTLTRGLPAGFF